MTHKCRRCGRDFRTSTDLQRHRVKEHRASRGTSRKLPWIVGALVLLTGAVGAVAILNAPSASTSAFELEDEPRIGRDDAPVTLVMFEDPSCPYCRKFHHSEAGPSTFQQLVDTYAADGTLRIYYKEFLAAKPWGQAGAIAQECAYTFGNDAFWNVTAKFYRDAPDLDTGNVRAFAMRYAREEGIETGPFEACLADDAALIEVRNDMRAGEKLGVGGTPAYFVVASDGTSELIVGPQPFDTFAQAIERAKAKVSL
ncbi:MAG: thioredoxin domain-containing protein [Candidatus Thermoplasmatota archaeon]